MYCGCTSSYSRWILVHEKEIGVLLGLRHGSAGFVTHLSPVCSVLCIYFKKIFSS